MMKRFLALTLLLCLLLPAALAEEASPATLTAVGEASLPRGGYAMRFELVALAETMEGAQARMTARLDALNALLGEHGVSPDALAGGETSMQDIRQYHYTKITEKVTQEGFKLTRSMTLLVQDEETAAALGLAMHAAGVTSDHDVSPVAADDPAAMDAALEAAAQQAMRQAEVLARAMGRELDRLVHVEQSAQGDTARVVATYTLK